MNNIFSNLRRPTLDDDEDDTQLSPDRAGLLRVKVANLSKNLHSVSTPEEIVQVYRTCACEFNNLGYSIEEVEAELNKAVSDDDYLIILGGLANEGFPKPVQAPPAATTPTTPAFVPEHNAGSQVIVSNTQHNQGSPIQKVSNAAFIDDTNYLRSLLNQKAFACAFVGDSATGLTALVKTSLHSLIFSSNQRPKLSITDFYCSRWNGLEEKVNIQYLQLVDHTSTEDISDIKEDPFLVISRDVANLYSNIRERERERVTRVIKKGHPSIFIVDGWGELINYTKNIKTNKKLSNELLNSIYTKMAYCIKAGPKVGVSILLTANKHTDLLFSTESLSALQIAFVGRLSTEGRGGYKAIDAFVADKTVVPSTADKNRLAYQLEICRAEKISIILLKDVLEIGKTPNISFIENYDLLHDFKATSTIGGLG